MSEVTPKLADTDLSQVTPELAETPLTPYQDIGVLRIKGQPRRRREDRGIKSCRAHFWVTHTKYRIPGHRAYGGNRVI